MGDIALRGAELKKLVAMAKKRDLNFAYCPGNDPKEDVFVLDLRKKPEVIGRTARAEGTGTKLGFGTAKAKGKVLSLTCEKELPQMAKKLKKFLKFEKIPMNVVVLDMSGKVLEEDVEDLGEDEDDDDADVADVTEEEETEDGTSEDTDDDAGRIKSLKARAADLKQKIEGLANADMQAKLGKAYTGAVGALKSGQLDTADGVLTKLEAALDKMPPAGSAAASTETDPALAKLQQVSDRLKKQIDDLENPDAASKLNTAHGMLETQIADGDVKKAATTAKALGDAITRAAAAAAPASADTEAADTDAGTEDLATTWADARADLEPVVLDLLQRNLGDVGKLRAVLGYFTEKGEAGDFTAALKAVPGLKKLIADAQTAEQTAAEQDIPTGVVPFVRARLDWVKTRTSLKAEMSKLQDAIIKTCDSTEFPTIGEDSKQLFGYLDTLDSRLEDALDALVQEPDGDKREKLKDNVRKLLNEFQSELDTPFFQAVDGGNGFKPVNVRGAAIASLGKVNEALSTSAAA